MLPFGELMIWKNSSYAFHIIFPLNHVMYKNIGLKLINKKKKIQMKFGTRIRYVYRGKLVCYHASYMIQVGRSSIRNKLRFMSDFSG